MWKQWILFVIVPAVALSACSNSNPEAEVAATAAAESWLANIDEGRYAESWQQAAPYFKGVMDEDQWVEAMEGMRAPLGETQSRTVHSTKYRTTLPGAPDGEYVVIEYRTAFERNQSAVETVTPMKDEDGTWRVSGYFIR